MKMNELKRRIMQAYILSKYGLVWMYRIITRRKSTDVWLISERGDEARDNGYAFYKYLKKNHPEIDLKYVISRKSPDIDRIDRNDVVYYRSLKHIIIFLTAKYLISTHIQGTSPEFRSFMKLAKHNLVRCSGKEIMLQHGVVQSYMPIMLKDNNPRLSLIISSSESEKKFFKNGFGYSEKQIVKSGLARYDYITSKPKKQILLMPTWRDYLYKSSKKQFEMSRYYNVFNSLINNKKLQKVLDENDYILVFYPHYEVQRFIKSFNTTSKKIIIANRNEYDVQRLLEESKILVTDYSSIHMDFAYMKKPLAYYQFDYEVFRSTQYKEGYYSYAKNGFGPVLKTEKSIIEFIRKHINNDGIMESKYKERGKKFFSFSDRKNCERIYKAIIGLEEDKE